jgi:hypothetical protein
MTVEPFRAKNHRNRNSSISLSEISERVAILGSHTAEHAARMDEIEQRQTSMAAKHEQLRRFVVGRAEGAA